MKRCWIHIGMHKTGTTSIQQTLSTILLPADWQYLRFGKYVNSGVPFFSMFSPNPTSYHWFKKLGQTHAEVVARGKKRRAMLKQQIENSNAEQFIISGEAISLLCREGIENMRSFLGALFDDIQIVAYVRAPIGFQTSMFQQRIKNGRSSFDAIKIPLAYRSRIENVDEVFGLDKVHLWKFDPKEFTNNCAVTDFCNRIGLPLNSSSKIVRSNESLTREGLGLLYAYRKFGDGYGKGVTVVKENKGIFNVLLAMKGEKFRFAPSLFSQLMPEDKNEINWMEIRLGQSLQENIDPNQTGGVANESELVIISRKTCESFVEEFEKMYDLKVPPIQMPKTNPVNPKVVADLVEYCRVLYRAHYLTKPKADIGMTSTLSIGDLVARATNQNESVLARMSKKRGRVLVKSIFAAIEESLQSLDPGETLQVRGLGQFSLVSTQSSEAVSKNHQARLIQFSPDTTKVA